MSAIAKPQPIAATSSNDAGGIPAASFNRHADARAKLRQAEEDLNAAIASLKSAAATFCKVEAEIHPEGGMRRLSDIAWSNKAEWSGGPANPSNIIEEILRAEAVEQLRQKVPL